MLEGQKKNLYKLNFYKSCKSSRPPNKSINNLLAWEEMLRFVVLAMYYRQTQKYVIQSRKKNNFLSYSLHAINLKKKK